MLHEMLNKVENEYFVPQFRNKLMKSVLTISIQYCPGILTSMIRHGKETKATR